MSDDLVRQMRDEAAAWREEVGGNALTTLLDKSAAAIDGLRTALERSVTAIDDWLNIYASDMCDEQRVKEAHERVNEYGTLWYIANVQEQNRAALASTPPLASDASPTVENIGDGAL